MITIKTNRELKNLKDEVLKDGSGEAFTVGGIVSTVLAGRVSNPQMGWDLGKKFATQKEVELKIEEAKFVKDELLENSKKEYGFTAIVIGQVIEILEEKPEATEKQK